MHRVTVCKDCPDREIGCHANCERYAEDKRALREHIETVREAKNKDKEYLDYKRKKYKRWKNCV